MTERPILFQGAMVRALLAGTKTQTRRAVRKQFAHDAVVAEVAATSPEGWQVSGHSGLWWDDAGACIDDAVRCPYGMPGDRLWVREAFARIDGQTRPWIETDYRATYTHGDRLGDALGIKKRWTPSIHMPRHASRITLEVTGVRVERLQDISIEDAKAEGAWPDVSVVDDCAKYFGTDVLAANPYRAFQMLWERINGVDAWASNPWVWVVEFKRVKP